MPTLTVITAGLSNPSTTRQVADSIVDAVSASVQSRGESVETHIVELREIVGDLSQVMTTGMASDRLNAIKAQLSASDGLIVVTPVFKASYSGLFKMFFDVLDTEALNGMPTIIAATAGTARHSLVLEYALRPLLTYMRAVVVPTSLFAATEDFGNEEGTNFQRRVARAAGELTNLMVSADAETSGTTTLPRKSGVDIDEDLMPFDELLKGLDGKN